MLNKLKAFLSRTPVKEKHMEKFSKEYYDELLAEYKMVSATITHIGQTDAARFARSHGPDVVTAAVTNLKVRKCELEGMLEVLQNYLDK